MAWHHIGDETTMVPQYETRLMPIERGAFGGLVTGSTKVPTGEVVEVTHSFWRCGDSECRALACTKKGEKPEGKCGKCKGGK